MDVIDPYIERYGERLYGLCRALCTSRADADDLYQETWLRAVRSFARYDPARPFAPWITRICVNVYRSQLRRRALSPVYKPLRHHRGEGRGPCRRPRAGAGGIRRAVRTPSPACRSGCASR